MTQQLREVIVFEWEYKPNALYCEKVQKCTAIYHGLGIDFIEFETGPGNFTTAIIEYKDGQLESVPIELIKFVTPSKTDNDAGS